MWPGCGKQVGRGQVQDWICHTHLRPKRFWSPRDEAFLRACYSDSLTKDLATVLGRPERQVFAKATKLGLKKDPAFVDAINKANGRNLNVGGYAHRFQKGIVPWNKGKSIEVVGRMAETQFKKGNRPYTWMPVGSTTVNTDGYLDKKVADGHGARYLCWKPVHRLVWEAANGPVPDGHLVRFKPGRKTTVEAEITLDAVECVTREEHAMSNGSLCSVPKELADVHRLRGQLVKAINRKLKEQRA
jgi:hypothetical protein